MADIGRHVVPDRAVAARQGAVQAAVPVVQADGRTVEFELAAIAEGRPVQNLLGAGCESLDLLQAIGIGQGEHGITVGDLGEVAADGLLRIVLRPRLGTLEVAADTLGGGVGRDQVRELPLEVLQLVHQVIVFVIADERVVVHVVAAAVLCQDSPQRLNPFPGLLFIHLSCYQLLPAAA